MEQDLEDGGKPGRGHGNSFQERDRIMAKVALKSRSATVVGGVDDYLYTTG